MPSDSLPVALLETIFNHGRFTVLKADQIHLVPVIYREFKKLDKLSQQILLLYYKDNRSQIAIAAYLKIHISKMRKILATSLLTLRRAGNPPYASKLEAIAKSPVFLP